jgi:hypothetical protein
MGNPAFALNPSMAYLNANGTLTFAALLATSNDNAPTTRVFPPGLSSLHRYPPSVRKMLKSISSAFAALDGAAFVATAAPPTPDAVGSGVVGSSRVALTADAAADADDVVDADDADDANDRPRTVSIADAPARDRTDGADIILAPSRTARARDAPAPPPPAPPPTAQAAAEEDDEQHATIDRARRIARSTPRMAHWRATRAASAPRSRVRKMYHSHSAWSRLVEESLAHLVASRAKNVSLA